jgi:hypothetical protein
LKFAGDMTVVESSANLLKSCLSELFISSISLALMPSRPVPIGESLKAWGLRGTQYTFNWGVVWTQPNQNQSALGYKLQPLAASLRS